MCANQASAHERATGKSIVRNVLPLKVGDVVPDAALVDEHGRPFHLRELRGKTLVLAFMYTRCPDPNECPLISANFAGLQRRIASGPFALVEVTLDPGYDSPARLLDYAKRFDANTRVWHFLTGDPERVLDFAAYFNVTRFDDPQRGVIGHRQAMRLRGGGLENDMATLLIDLPVAVMAAKVPHR